jgi:tRNA/tmRNA/rRNA uracil-C5-methylase (TrmA/RlmC/RlmD family)
VVPVDRCRIAHPAIDDVGATRLRWPAGSGVEVVVGPEDRAVVVSPREDAGRLRLPTPDGATAVLVSAGQGRPRQIRGRGWVRELAAGRSWRVAADGFWQVHPGAAETLVSAVVEGLQARPGERALDLYCGVGLFAAVLAEGVGPLGSVLAVESDHGAVADARRNLHDLPNVRIVDDRVERALRQLPDDEVDLVVLDPPRAGAGRAVVDEIARRRPRRIAYVACDPAALARDVAFLKGTYRLSGLRAFDLFPMTHHVECVATLVPFPSE